MTEKASSGRNEHNSQITPIREKLKPVLDSIPKHDDPSSTISRDASRALVGCIKDKTSSNDEGAFRLEKVFTTSMKNDIYALKPPPYFKSIYGIDTVYIQHGKRGFPQLVLFEETTNPSVSTDITEENFRKSMAFDSSKFPDSDIQRAKYSRAMETVLSAISEHGIHKDPEKLLPEINTSDDSPSVNAHKNTAIKSIEDMDPVPPRMKERLQPVLDSIPAGGEVDRNSDISKRASNALVACITDKSISSSNDEGAFRLGSFLKKGYPDINVYTLKPPSAFSEENGIETIYIENGEYDFQQAVRFTYKSPYRSTELTPSAENLRIATGFDPCILPGYDKKRDEYIQTMRIILSEISEHGIHKDPEKLLPESKSSSESPAISMGSTIHSGDSQESRIAVKEIRREEKEQLGPLHFLEKNINDLAGYTRENGEKVAGSLLTGSLDEELLRTIGGEEYETLYEEIINKGPKSVIFDTREFLTDSLIALNYSSEKELLFSVHFGSSMERGKDRVNYYPASRGKYRDIPLTTEGKFIDIQIKPTDPDINIKKVKRFQNMDAAPGDFSDTNEENLTGLTDNHKFGIKESRDFRPTFEITLTEKTPYGDEETYKIWRLNDGILVQCPNSNIPTFYRRDMIAAGGAMVSRKPVIYLYPQKATNITVQLDYKGKLTNTYPHITGNTWKAHAQPDGTLTVNGKKYKYLFWDGINNNIAWDWSKGFCVHKDEVDSFLEEKITQLGLNFAEAQDFITYWAPMMKQNQWSLVSFQTERYEELAKLNITPSPDAMIRLFMIFKKVSHRYDIPEQKLTTIKRKGFTVVEWGGSNLDELPVQKLDGT